MFCSECGAKNEKGVAFCSECGKKLSDNSNKSNIKKGSKRKGFLIVSIILFIATAALIIYGYQENNDFSSRLHSFFSSGNANAGDIYIHIGIGTLVVAIIFLVLFFTKRKKEK